MEHRGLGRNSVRVSTLCLEAMSFGAMGNRDVADCVRIVHRALDGGINFLDTADVYSQGESEDIFGKALTSRQDDVVLATKVYNSMGCNKNTSGAPRRWIVMACEDSLRRLGIDRIDLYQVHRPDEHTDVDQTLGAPSDLVRDGKVLMVGTSTFPAHKIVEAHWASEQRGHMRFRCEHPPYSIFVRNAERDVLPACERYGVGAIVWSPLNSGWLTGKYRRDQAPAAGSRFASLGRASWSAGAPGAQLKLALLPELEALAADAGLDLISLALSFTLAHRAVTLTIIGLRTMEQLESQLPAGDLTLSKDVLDRIDEIVDSGDTVSRADIAYEPQSIRDARAGRQVSVR